MPTDIADQFDYERCPKHPARQVVNSGEAAKRWCAECIEQHKQNYADRMTARDKEIRNDPSKGFWGSDMDKCAASGLPLNRPNFDAFKSFKGKDE